MIRSSHCKAGNYFMVDNSYIFLKYVTAWLKHNLHKIQEAVISRQDLVRPIKSDNIRQVTIINCFLSCKIN